MHDARDAEDSRSAERRSTRSGSGTTCTRGGVGLGARTGRVAAEEVVQRVFLRPASELAAGKIYGSRDVYTTSDSGRHAQREQARLG
jgi:hypothetical protein